MPHIRTLEVLNDCSESERILLKFPDWLVSSWNHKALEVRQTRAVYPSFKELVDFLSKEIDLACDPITSIQALKVVESDKSNIHEAKPYMQRLCLQTLDRAVSHHGSTGHFLAKCIKFCEKIVSSSCKQRKFALDV